MNLPVGNSTSIFFRLLPVAPFNITDVPPPGLRFSGTGIFFSFLRYCAVRVSLAAISSGGPDAITFPPCLPAKGPRSMIWSAERIISLSCSTTIMELFASLSSFKAFISFLLSR